MGCGYTFGLVGNDTSAGTEGSQYRSRDQALPADSEPEYYILSTKVRSLIHSSQQAEELCRNVTVRVPEDSFAALTLADGRFRDMVSDDSP